MSKKPVVPDPGSVTFAPLGAESGCSAVDVDSAFVLADVVAWIRSPYRTSPVVVVTSGGDGADPWIDAEALVAARSDASVYVIRRAELTWLLAEYLPGKWEVFGGGGRVYPPRIDWSGSPYGAPLVLCSGEEEAGRATGALIEHLRRPVQSRPTPRQRSQPTPAPVPPAPPKSEETKSAQSGASRVGTPLEAVELARYLQEPSRRFPVVVVTNATGHAPYLDYERIAHDLDGLAEVCLLVQGEASWAFTGALPARLGVFGGAARVYPVGQDWLKDETRAPLKFCWDGVGSPRITTEVIEAGLSAAHAAGLLTATAAPAKAKACSALVQGPMGGFHVLLELPDGGQAVALTAAIRPGIPADRLVTKGLSLSGYVDGEGVGLAQFQPLAILDDPQARVRSTYPVGAVVLAKVVDVGELSAKVALHPDVEIWLLGDASGPSLARMIDAGDVIAVQLHEDGDRLQCRLPESDESPLPAVSVIPDGPPWLLPDDLIEGEEPSEAAPAEAPVPLEEVTPTKQVTPQAADPRMLGQLQAVDRERDLLDARLARAESELAAAKAEASRLRRSLRDADKKAKQAGRRADELEGRAHGIGVFSDPAEQLRHEIRLQYLHRIGESERADRPLAEYRFGPRFLDSLADLEGVARDKVVDVLVEVLTGLASTIHGRQLHPWRAGVVGPQETRADGGAAWRCSLQVNTPSARRLKYWQLPRGTVEFDSVGVHDQGI